MIISGVCATVHSAVSGHILLGQAIDCAQRVPLLVEHQHEREIGRVVHLQYCGNDLHLIAELDDPVDPAVLKLDYFSPMGRVLERVQRGSVYHAGKLRLEEVSLVAAAANDRCKVLERKAGSPDPMRKFTRLKAREADLLIARMSCMTKMLAVLQGRLA